MTSTNFLLFFGPLALAGIVGFVALQLKEWRDAREIERRRLARVAAFKAPILNGRYNPPDGD